MNIPEGMPSLAHGAHNPDEGKACVMEYVALLAGEVWTDSPECTNVLIASLARATNDAVPDKDRNTILVPLIPRLLAANINDAKTYIVLDRTFREHVGSQAVAHTQDYCRWWHQMTEEASPAMILTYGGDAHGNPMPWADRLSALLAVLDKYEEMHGKPEPVAAERHTAVIERLTRV